MLIDEYRAGNYQGVWDTLRSLRADVRSDSLFADALAVARETMTRVRYNLALLATRLAQIEYRFANPATCLAPPPATTPEMIACLETAIGPLPLSLQAFYELVGSVDFCQHPSQQVAWMDAQRAHASPVQILGEQDPLFVLPLEALYNDVLQAMNSKQRRGRYARYGWRPGGESRWYCWFAPDECHKAGYSGGEDYNLFLPDSAADFRIRDLFLMESEDEELDREWFVDHLRRSCMGGGFRGAASPETHRKQPPSWDILQTVTEGLLPF